MDRRTGAMRADSSEQASGASSVRGTCIGRRAFVCASALSAASLVLGGCATVKADTTAETTAAQDASSAGAATTQATQAADAALTPEELFERSVEEKLASLTLEQRIYQLFCVRPEALTGEGAVVEVGDAMRAALQERPVGGVTFFGQNITGADQFRALVADMRAVPCAVTPFLAIDEEGGPLVARVAKSGFFDVPVFPAMLEVGDAGDPQAAFNVGAAIGTYLSELGIDVDYAPDADVLTNPDSSIGSRSFSSDPSVAAAMVEQAVKGLQTLGVSATVKHFPGHGDVVADSHTGAAVSERTIDELRACEFLPFKAGIDAGVDFVMIGHISTPNAAADGLPASLSSIPITGWLRQELGFDGIVISDSFIMGAVTDYYSSDVAAVAFIAAGGDVVLDPEDFGLAVQGVIDAVQEGTLTSERIDESVRRILRMKMRKQTA